jgi:hypothetical protein
MTIDSIILQNNLLHMVMAPAALMCKGLFCRILLRMVHNILEPVLGRPSEKE